MSEHPPATTVVPTHSAQHSLRSRWVRAFVCVLLALVSGVFVSIVGTQLVVGSYRDTAQRLEAEADLLARLRTDIVDEVILMAAPTQTPLELAKQETLARRIESGFERGVRDTYSPAGRQLLTAGYIKWSGVLASIRAVPEASVEVRAAVMSAGFTQEVPKVLSIVDDASAASRDTARDELARTLQVERATYAGLLVMSLVALALMVRFARRLSTEVLGPVSGLRDSANRLAAGELTHRVGVTSEDEIGDLARSFNTMADAIAGSQATLTQQANHDPLTGLANREGLRLRAEAAFVGPERRNGSQVLLFLDLDDFKNVNDLLGHAAGDELLRVVAGRLADVVRPGDVVARIGGDEFALLLDGIPDLAAAVALAHRAVAGVIQPVRILGEWVEVGASIGLAVHRPGDNLDVLMQEADLAMYAAKGHGKCRVECYDPVLHSTAVEQHALRGDLAQVVERGELVLDYQPVVDLRTEEIVGVEALVRWQHPSRGLLPPSAFIELAEQTGNITAIGEWVLTTAAQQVRHWQERHARPSLWLSVNVSVCQLEVPGFADLVTRVLDATELDPATLILEVTESVLAGPTDGAAEALEEMRRTGIRVALDDFGTGYCSIDYLRQLPLDVLKIDRSFVSGPESTAAGHALLEAIVGLGQHLGLDVIPEGIERPEELARMRALGCATGQGYLLSRPLPPSEIGARLAAAASSPSLLAAVIQRSGSPGTGRTPRRCA